MLTVHVDRSSVAMADDFESHLVTWHLKDDATLGELLVRIVEGSFLPHVHGSVAWSLTMGGRELTTTKDGSTYLRSTDGPQVTLAVLFVPLGREPQVSVLWHSGLGDLLRTLTLARTGRDRAFYLRYASGGALRPWAAVRSHWSPSG